jgi:N-acetyl-gamma-glutamyl-phosphate reductase
MKAVFIDGQEGTTGLKIRDRLMNRKDINLLEIPSEDRKNNKVKAEYLNNADVVILCLPDAAAMESASLVTNPGTCIIDASTAFRTDDDWVYGMPELNSSQRERIRKAKRISNPGCHATGFIIAALPLVESGVVASNYPVTATSVTGYSGGGKKLIERFQTSKQPSDILNAPLHYALGLNHKHLPEMKKRAGLDAIPLFLPIVSNFYNGMVVTVPLHKHLLSKKVSVNDCHQIMSERYQNQPFIRILPMNHEEVLDGGFLQPTVCNDTNFLDIFVTGNQDQILVMTRFDNLGKGASGAAIQNLNIVCGFDETAGLM